ncbi:Lrp/AsnC family transcriptional regulator [Geodermatophilus sp. DF01-2]|uniref:Lrp/AsnC family transcriptional regulator n=1 Tax=Geodermatophilus sp. DF01-2 TaxID=2559610 RepID=UPI001ADD9DD1|nr:Lrp/AsnC family transcriptional regulator [Geodermatophilus sp. DF01_2]
MPPEFSEDDLALVHALQVHPRASWAALAPVLGASAATLARRWERLRGEGLAWVTSYPAAALSGGAVTALVEVDCAAGALDGVCSRLEATPHVATIEHAARGRDLVLTVVAPSFARMSSIVLDELARLPGVVSTRTHIASRVHVEGSRWRLDALDAAQRTRVRALAAAEERPAALVDAASAVYAPLVRELARDGRAGAAALAARMGRPTSTVRRQLAALVRSRSLTFRCDVAQVLTRWPVCVTWWCRVPGTAVDALVAQVRHEPRVRLCLSLTGPANLLVTAWTSSLADLTRTQTWLEKAMPAGEIVDASVILRTRKRMGWRLHPDGRATGEVVPLVASGDGP